LSRVPRSLQCRDTRILVALLASAIVLSCGGGSATVGTTYNDPEGTYTIQVDPAWEIQVGAVAAGVEVWFVGPVEGDFRPNLNLLTQSAAGMSLADYTTTSVANGPKLIADFKVVSESRIDSPGTTLEVLEYTGTTQGRQLHFLAVFGVRSDRAIVATLTTGSATFAGWRSTIEPYLRTLRLT
jgi:hypothetical protein